MGGGHLLLRSDSPRRHAPHKKIFKDDSTKKRCKDLAVFRDIHMQMVANLFAATSQHPLSRLYRTHKPVTGLNLGAAAAEKVYGFSWSETGAYADRIRDIWVLRGGQWDQRHSPSGRHACVRINHPSFMITIYTEQAAVFAGFTYVIKPYSLGLVLRRSLIIYQDVV